MKKQIVILGLLIFSFSSISLIGAHAPSSMDLVFDYDTDTLTVKVYHSVSDINTHNIELIQVYVNGLINETRGYSVQTTTSFHEDTFVIPAVHGDIIMVNATCNISGNVIDQITLDDPAVAEFTFLAPILLMIVAGSIVGLVGFRKRK